MVDDVPADRVSTAGVTTAAEIRAATVDMNRRFGTSVERVSLYGIVVVAELDPVKDVGCCDLVGRDDTIIARARRIGDKDNAKLRTGYNIPRN